MKKSEGRLQLDSQRSLAAKNFCKDYSREKRYLIILARDLKDGSSLIKNKGIEEAREFQKFWDFILDFEKLQALMKEFRWTPDYLKKNGIDFQSYRKLYFAAC